MELANINYDPVYETIPMASFIYIYFNKNKCRTRSYCKVNAKKI